MNSRQSQRCGRIGKMAASLFLGGSIAACGGGNTGNPSDSGIGLTYLSVDASDVDGDALHYQWRVNAGTIENRDSNQTVWTMPNGPGLHFAYVTISDNRGGYATQQYAVSTDTFGTSAPQLSPVTNTPPAIVDFDGSAYRLRFSPPNETLFTPPTGGMATARIVYLPDVQVQVVGPGNTVVFSGTTDLSGEVDLPKLQNNQSYEVQCATSPGAPLVNCLPFTASTQASVISVSPPLTAGRNLRLFGHVGLADGGVCGAQNEYFGLQSTASVQLMASDGTALGSPVRVNRFGDYGLDAAVPVKASLKLQVQCESYSNTLSVPASPDPAGYVSTSPIELSLQISNSRPQVVNMVANGADGNVRGRMVIVEGPGGQSNGMPGPFEFLSYKGDDTPLSACMYYRALGAVGGCDAQGNMISPISFDDWKRQHQLAPFSGAAPEVAANYVNRNDLNLVRRMVATQPNPNDIAYYVCNTPGPDGSTQVEVDALLDAAISGQQEVACVAMEWSITPGVNNGLPFTKFLTFAPDGSLLASINLDGRGEKFMPGACVACHGGSQYNGHFPEHGNPSAFLGAGFLPFDTNNYAFGSAAGLSEAEQSAAFHALNELARATEVSDTTALSNLVKGWYADGTSTLNKAYVPPAWMAADAVPATAGAARFYQQVVGISCRTCHASLGPTFNWDQTVLTPALAQAHFCGGTADVASNASMPNALITRDRLADRVQVDPTLATLMNTFLGCSAPLPDPVYPQH